MKRIACYVRVSTEEQRKHGISVDNQIDALTQYCQNNNAEIVGIYNDAGFSASKSYKKRPALAQMVNDCQEGKIDLIIFTRLDRFFRNVSDYYACIDLLNGVPWKAIWEDYETETSSGVFKVNIMLSIAQAEAQRTSEKIKSVNEYRRAKGEYIGLPPLGYKVENKKLVKDAETASLIEGIFKTYHETYSSKECLKYCRDQGHPISKSTLLRILRNRAYMGDANGIGCDAYITEDIYNLNRSIAEKYTRSTEKVRTYLFCGLCKCAICGNRMKGTSSGANINGKQWKTYKCKHKGSNSEKGIALSERKIERYLLNELDNLINQHNYEIESHPINEIRIESEKKKASLEAKLKRIGIRFEDGDLSEEEYRSKRSAVIREISEIDFGSDQKPIEIPSNWKDVYNDLDEEHRRAFWHSILKSIEILNDQHIKINFL